jgi:hypothetical protein
VNEDPDWLPTDPTAGQVQEWMREHAKEASSAEELAWAAYLLFARPFHFFLMKKWADTMWEAE